MFDIKRTAEGNIIFTGRLDASKSDQARTFLSSISNSCTLDFSELEYISSAGLSVLLAAQKRLGESGHSIKIINLNTHIENIFRVAGFDFVFDLD
jgi:anti-sigma B factor antagonist